MGLRVSLLERGLDSWSQAVKASPALVHMAGKSMGDGEQTSHSLDAVFGGRTVWSLETLNRYRPLNLSGTWVSSPEMERRAASLPQGGSLIILLPCEALAEETKDFLCLLSFPPPLHQPFIHFNSFLLQSSFIDVRNSFCHQAGIF